jgi:acetamidase/formamidase
MAHSFHVTAKERHLKWSQALKPVLTVPSGSEVSFDLLDGGHNQIRPDNQATALHDFDFQMADPAIGPVYIEGAEPGDILVVEILDLKPADYGWTALLPGFGLLADEFEAETPQLKLWNLTDEATIARQGSKRKMAVLKPGVAVPVRPFLGVVGVAPAVAGELSTIPPYASSGGNMDCRDLSAVGAKVYLPVNVPGALFSCGDGHAAQGDGEVCGTAIETPMKARLRLTIEKAADWTLKGKKVLECPHYITPKKGREEIEEEVLADKGEYAALGIHEDIREASRMAVRGLIDWLEAEKSMTRVEAYMLCSVASKLRMSEVVDMPNYAVSCALPLDVFIDE